MGRAMHDHPPKDLAGIVASLVFVAALVILTLIGAVLLIAF
jgi:predicted trehalose synthase